MLAHAAAAATRVGDLPCGLGRRRRCADGDRASDRLGLLAGHRPRRSSSATHRSLRGARRACRRLAAGLVALGVRGAWPSCWSATSTWCRCCSPCSACGLRLDAAMTTARRDGRTRAPRSSSRAPLASRAPRGAQAVDVGALAARRGARPGAATPNSAYVLFTSGSPGARRAEVPHRTAAQVLRGMQEHLALRARRLAARRRCPSTSRCSVFLPLTVGAAVVVARRDAVLDRAPSSTSCADAGDRQLTPSAHPLRGGLRGRRRCGRARGRRSVTADSPRRSREPCRWSGRLRPTETTKSVVARPRHRGGAVTIGHPRRTRSSWPTRSAGTPAARRRRAVHRRASLAHATSRRADDRPLRRIRTPRPGPGATARATRARAGDGRVEWLDRLDGRCAGTTSAGEVETAFRRAPGLSVAARVVDTDGGARLVVYPLARWSGRRRGDRATRPRPPRRRARSRAISAGRGRERSPSSAHRERQGGPSPPPVARARGGGLPRRRRHPPGPWARWPTPTRSPVAAVALPETVRVVEAAFAEIRARPGRPGGRATELLRVGDSLRRYGSSACSGPGSGRSATSHAARRPRSRPGACAPATRAAHRGWPPPRQLAFLFATEADPRYAEHVVSRRRGRTSSTRSRAGRSRGAAAVALSRRAPRRRSRRTSAPPRVGAPERTTPTSGDRGRGRRPAPRSRSAPAGRAQAGGGGGAVLPPRVARQLLRRAARRRRRPRLRRGRPRGRRQGRAPRRPLHGRAAVRPAPAPSYGQLRARTSPSIAAAVRRYPPPRPAPPHDALPRGPRRRRRRGGRGASPTVRVAVLLGRARPCRARRAASACW